MDDLTVFPDQPMSASGAGAVAGKFLDLGIKTFRDACRHVHELPYGYNSDRDDFMLLFTEKMGTCTTKHAVIATLATELNLPIEKHVGIYAMTEEIVSGAQQILDKYGLPYVPLLHCFLVYQRYRVDLTQGNRNGKNRSVDNFLFSAKVAANICARDEYRLYRSALNDLVLTRPELSGIDVRRILQARQEGLVLLKTNVDKCPASDRLSRPGAF